MNINLSLVKEAVVKVVPDIESEIFCIRCGKDRGYIFGCKDEFGRKYEKHSPMKSARPIQLPDVLRTIKSHRNISAKKWFDAVDFLVARAQWNLALSLDDQPQPVIDFLAALFKQK